MKVTKCDLCKKSVKGETINVGYGLWNHKELCKQCGLPVFGFLKKHNLIKYNNKLEALSKGKIAI